MVVQVWWSPAETMSAAVHCVLLLHAMSKEGPHPCNPHPGTLLKAGRRPL